MDNESDVALPKATISKMIKDSLPSDIRVAGDAVDMIIECCTEFVHLISSEANEIATQESKTIIHPEHVVKALEQLGFKEWVASVMQAWEVWKVENKGVQKVGGRKTMADKAGLTEEQQIALQQQMFAAARARTQNVEGGESHLSK